MVFRTIKISEENYKWLLNIAADLQKKRGEPTSFDDALTEIKLRYRRMRGKMVK
jgi:hypothetical protein